jgi:thioesterase domain-containing protein/acyl carrier protein
MLTSGSTGNAKAVRITHRQILAAIAGKASVRRLPPDKPFLNWIGLDHVASLVEMHIQALWLGVDQIHVHAADVVSAPQTFLELLSRHRVSRTFAPNFFLGRLVSTVAEGGQRNNNHWDLSSLTVVASGGEANDVKTAVAASALFERYGARRNVITPGFGMTETCAGAIYNMACPDYDIQHGGRAVASVGKCMKGIEMRVVVGSRLAAADEPGDLEVRGEVVFDGYYRNEKATADAFPSPGGWFRTGDQACRDRGGNLCLIGRASEVVNINGVKVVAADLDSLLEQTLGHRVARFVVFPSRAAHTEQITICYVPPSWPHSVEEMAEIDDLAARVCITSASARPLVFSLRESSLPLLPTSTLGKISRTKMQSLFEAGVFGEDVTLHGEALNVYIQEKQPDLSMESVTEAEASLISDFAQVLNIDSRRIGPETRVFELGFTSMDLIRLKHRIDTRLGTTMPVITLMKNPTARSLANALGLNHSDGPQASTVTEYDPVVTFKPNGTKTPLWLIHPGVGEVLVFVGLAEHLADDDRPIYALRSRGFETGQTRFGSISEAVDTYVQAVRRRQPHGPYALAGYSYGTMLAFEVAKRLDALEGGVGSAVGFLGSFNLPPHIKSRMRQLSWNMCLLHLTQFLGLTTEAFVDGVHDEGVNGTYRGAARGEALTTVLRAADGSRMAELGLEGGALARWADVAFGLQSMAADYDPDGQVAGIDVFHAVPLKVAAASREEWVGEHLSKWRDFARSEPRLHAVGGAHYTMIGPAHVVGFAAKLKGALAARGI